MSWRDNSQNEIGFEVERTNNGSTQLLQQYADQTTLDDTGLKKNTWYYYRLRAVGVAGPSPWTNRVRVKTPRW